MEDNIRKAIEAYLGRVEQACEDSQGHEDGDVAYELRQILISDEHKALKAVLRPSREEIADKLESLARSYAMQKGNSVVENLDMAIEELRSK